MTRKRILILLTIVLLLAGGVFVWGLISKKSPEPVSEPGSGIKQVLGETAISPIPSFDRSALWYFNQDGQLFRVDTDGSNLSEFPLPDLGSKLSSALWPDTGNDFIAINEAGNKNFYSSDSKGYISLPTNIQSIDWMPDGKRVIYIWKSGDNLSQSLVLANADGTGFRTIAPVFWADLIVKASPDGRLALMYRKNITGDTNKIYLVDLQTGAISTAVEAGKNTGAKWLPGMDKFVYMQATGQPFPRLYLYDVETHTSLDLNLNTTLDKIVFDASGQTLYAAVAQSSSTKDIFVKVSLANMKQETYFEPAEEVRGNNLMLLGNTLFFTNSRDGKIYYIQK